MNLLNQLEILRDTTKSPEVKTICESHIQEIKSGKPINETELLESVKNIENMEPLPKETNPFEAIRNEELDRSKAAAAKLMESWGGMGSRVQKTAGSYSEAKEDKSKKETVNISESLSNVDDGAAKAFVASQGVNNLGVYEAISNLKGKGIYEHPNIKVLCEKYTHLIKDTNLPEYLIAESFVSEFANFTWDDGIKSTHKEISEKINNLKPEIEVSKAIYAIEKNAGADFYSPVTESLNKWLVSENKSVALLNKEITRWSFNPVVRNLVNTLSLMENDSDKLNIPVNVGNSAVKRIFSPVLVGGNKTIFTIGNNIFEGNEEKIKRLNRKEYSELPEEFRELLNAFYSPTVKVNEQGLSVYIGSKSFRIVEENETVNLYSKDLRLQTADKSKLASQIALEISGSFGVNESKAVADVIRLYENFDKIVELNFAKRLISNLYEGASINLIKWAGKIYLNRINESMNENSIFEVNGTQATNMVKDFLKYDISEGLTQFLEGESKIKSIMLNDRTQIIENIAIVEGEINKLKTLIENNPLYSNSKEIERTQSLLETELKTLRNKWKAINEEIEKIENGQTEQLDLNEDDKFTIGAYVKVKESGNTGKVISVDSTTGNYTVLMDNGRTGDFRVDEILDIEDALAEDPTETPSDEEVNVEMPAEEGGEEGEEVVKEGEQQLAKAPAKKKATPSNPKPAADLKKATSAAPKAAGQDKNGKKDVVNLKDANLEDTPDDKNKDINFEVKVKTDVGGKIGYNVSEENVEENAEDTLAKAPTDGETELSEKSDLEKTDQKLAKAPGGSKEIKYPNKTVKGKANNPDIIKIDQELASAPGDDKGKELTHKVDNEMGYNTSESDLEKTDQKLAKAPGGEKEIKYSVKTVEGKAKNPDVMKIDQKLAEAPSKGADADVNVKVNKEMGYNLKEEETPITESIESKKN